MYDNDNVDADGIVNKVSDDGNVSTVVKFCDANSNFDTDANTDVNTDANTNVNTDVNTDASHDNSDSDGNNNKPSTPSHRDPKKSDIDGITIKNEEVMKPKLIVPLSPWKKSLNQSAIVCESNQNPLSLLSIMASQEAGNMEKNNTFEDNLKCAESVDKGELTEDEMIRLAIEASLSNSDQTEAKTLDPVVDEDILSAIQASLVEMTIESSKDSPTKYETEDSIIKHDIQEEYMEKSPTDGNKSRASHILQFDCGEKVKEIPLINNNLKDNYTRGSVGFEHTIPVDLKGTFSTSLTDKENEDIAQAIRDADDAEMHKSLKLAQQLLQDDEEVENEKIFARKHLNKDQGNVRTVSRQEFNSFKPVDDTVTTENEQNRQLWGEDDYEYHQDYFGTDITCQTSEEDHYKPEGFRLNSSTPSRLWSRHDKNTIIGPNNEIRTKHDVALKNQANAERLLLPKKSINDKAFNSFNQSFKKTMKRSTVKGVAAHGHGRAERAENFDKTHGGALDGNVRLLINKSINTGLIMGCNGVVKEGKEAIVYHADGGPESGNGSYQFDVAIKVFKRIQEFRGRSSYIDGDPR